MQRIQSIPIQIKLNESQIRDAMSKSEKSRVSYEVQVLRTGVFHHPDFGQFDITVPMLQSMVQNWTDNVRGVDISVDYSHNSQDISAGWISGLVLRANDTELWAMVDWTPKGIQRLSEREFRYLSADFTLNYQDNETLKTYGPTLLGAGLTNRPFVKNMKPAVTLAELGKEKDMNVEELKKQLADMEAKNKELAETVAGYDKKNYEKALSDKDAELKKEKDRVAELIKEKAIADKEREFDKLLTEGRACPAQKDAFMAGDVAKFASLAKEVNFTAKGSGSKADDSAEGDVSDKVIELAEKKISGDKKLSLGRAISMVLHENPKLAKEYNRAEGE